MCSVDYGESAAIWEDAYPIARKTYRCVACHGQILPGTPYLRWSCLSDGEWSNERACIACAFAREEFSAAHNWYMPPSCLVGELRSCIGENDDEEDKWRPVLAGVLKRRRTFSRLGIQQVSP